MISRIKNIELEPVPCNFCGANNFRFLFKKPDTVFWPDEREFSVVQCKNCKLGYLNPRPTVNSMKRYYPVAFYEDYESDKYLKRYATQAEFLPKLSNEHVLDLGCARGNFLIFLKKMYPSIIVYGVDPFSDKVNSKEILFYGKNLLDCHFEDSTFDLVTAWFVFEHLYDPKSYFKEVARILKPGGRFVFAVQNLKSLWGRAGYWEDVPRHLYFFSKKILKKYAQNFGFEMSKCVCDDSILDGRGTHSFEFLFGKLFGANWIRLRKGKLSVFQKKSRKLGAFLDKKIFSTHWESRLGISGTMIVEFIKKQ